MWDFFGSLRILGKNFKQIIQAKFIIINSIAVVINPSILLLSYYLKLSRKHVYIYWHESGWHWKGLVYEKSGIRGIILNKIINHLIKNSIIMAVSNYCIKWLKIKFNLKAKIELLYNTIDFRRIIRLSKLGCIDFSENMYKVIMAIGPVKPRKGFDYFLDVADKTPHSYKFVWVGKADILDEIYDQRIKLINKRSGYEKIIILDFTHNPYSLLNKCDIFFLPSLDEPFGIVYLEAFALGKFVICPTTSGFSEIIIGKKKLGFIYQNIDQVIDLLKSKDIDLYIKEHKEERVILAKKFDKKYFFKNFIDTLNKYS